MSTQARRHMTGSEVSTTALGVIAAAARPAGDGQRYAAALAELDRLGLAPPVLARVAAVLAATAAMAYSEQDITATWDAARHGTPPAAVY